ncbi:hypothetical protein [Helicobacter pylori]|uniref:hypothetical protein n=1 Tax=Helicobacter pylori TaxID=210 RepID=UPI0013CE27F0|nr:hypothetical protein [Helicobacter pylori]
MFKRISVSHQASDIFLITACKRSKLKDNPLLQANPKLFGLRERSYKLAFY